MKILPTMEGGLRIDLEDERDRSIFELLIWDARGKKEDWLAKRLGVLMEDDWNEFIVPELSAHFAAQIELVAKALNEAKESGGEGEGSFFITRENGERWYGVLNQARLALESRWKLAAFEESDILEDEDEERMGAYFRSRFYLLMQSKLLDHVM